MNNCITCKHYKRIARGHWSNEYGKCTAPFEIVGETPAALVNLPIYIESDKVYFGNNNKGIPFTECPRFEEPDND